MGQFERIDLERYHGKWLIVDIDGVLAVEQVSIPLEQRPVVSEARESMERLHQKGYKILLCTSRFRSEKEETAAWLNNNKIPYDDIVFGKPRGILYIDDRGYRFENWQKFFDDVAL